MASWVGFLGRGILGRDILGRDFLGGQDRMKRFYENGLPVVTGISKRSLLTGSPWGKD